MQTFMFIGFGLIGGSIAKRLKKNQPDCTILAYSRTRERLLAAMQDGIVDRILDEPDETEAVTASNIIFLCTPVIYIEAYLRRLAPVILHKEGCADTVLTDVGSTKYDIFETIERLGLSSHYVGGHPMAGSEKTGYENAKEHLLENAYYILTPCADTPVHMTETMRQLAAGLGAIPLVLDAAEHDYAVAAISHLPHLIAATLVNLVHASDNPEQIMKQIAAGGFKDITRIASSSPEMWEQICMSNRGPIVRLLDDYIASLQSVRTAVEAKDGEYIYQLFDASRTYRDSISNQNRSPLPVEYSIYCDIADETGAIATISTVLAGQHISIRNIGIIHNRDTEEGVLKIEFYTQDAKERAAEILQSKMYTVFPR